MKHNELNTPPWHHQSDHESCFHLEVFTLMWWFWISPGPLCPRSAASLALRRCPLFGSWSRRRWWWCSCLQDTRAPSQSLSGRQSLQTRLYFCYLTVSNNMNNHLISRIANNHKHQTRSSKPSAEYVKYILQSLWVLDCWMDNRSNLKTSRWTLGRLQWTFFQFSNIWLIN